MEKCLYLASKRDASLRRGHPWIFSGAIHRVTGAPAAGETVDVCSADGTFLARAAYSPNSQIRARVWTFDKDETIQGAFFGRRISKALAYREAIGCGKLEAYRLVHGEADGLPALIVDKYGPYLSCSFLAAGPEAWKKTIVEQLAQLVPGVKGIYERSDAEARRREGLEISDGLLWGEMPPEDFCIKENGIVFRMDMPGGHKTGFYLDQRENRLAIDRLAAGKSVLDCCCYSGAFGIRAAKAGASSVRFLDYAPSAIELAKTNVALNGLEGDSRIEFEQADMFQQLRKYRDARQSFDVIVLDPPKFAATHGQLLKAAHGYKDVNLLALKLLKPGGTLLTYSCSAAMTPEFFGTILAEAMTDAHRTGRVVQSFSQAPDHPRSLAFPEGHYLTGLEICVE